MRWRPSTTRPSRRRRSVVARNSEAYCAVAPDVGGLRFARAPSVPTESECALDTYVGAYSYRRTGTHFAGICANPPTASLAFAQAFSYHLPAHIEAGKP